jgi:hypothetical protein
MKIENQVCTLEQAKKLKELGVTAEPLFWYVIDIDPITPLDIIQKWQHSNFDQCEKYSAFTVAELGVMIDWNHVSQSGPYKEDQHFYCFTHLQDYSDKNEAIVRADMLIYLLENHLTTPEEVNQRLNS